MRFTRFLESPGLTRTKLLGFLMERLCAGFGTRECLIFSGSASQSVYELSVGQGWLFRTLNSDTLVRCDERTVFGICLARGENVFIQQARDPKLRMHLPSWLATTTPFAAFLLLPIAFGPRVCGVALVGWQKPGQAQLESGQARMLKQLLAQTAQVYERIT